MNRALLVFAIASLSIAGCGTPNPCQSVTGTCINARVEGTFTDLDQLEVTAGAAALRTPEVAKHFDLPIVFALVPPAGVTTTAEVTIAGLSKGVERGRATKTIAVMAGKTTSVTFVLGGAGTDDLSMPTDGGDGDGFDAAGADFAGCVPINPCAATTFGMQSDGCGNMVSCGDPHVTDVTPRAASAGDRIVISGRFPGTVTSVTFPGGAGATVDASDLTRILVRMPGTATAGPILLNYSGTMMTTPSVRRIAFPVGLQPFFPYYEQAGNGRVTQGMQTARSFHTTLAERGYVYVFGGQGPATALDSVERALINADGTLFRFVTQPVTLTTPRRRHAMASSLGRVFLIGGENGASTLDTVESSQIAPDHTLGAFAISTSKLTVPRAGATAVVIGEYLYVIGGSGLKSVERAIIHDDGSLGSFQDAGIVLTDARYGGTAVVAGKYLYVLGGFGATSFLATIDRATIMADGSLSTTTAGVFDVAAQALPAARAYHTATLIGSRLVVAGGENTGGRITPSAIANLTLDGDFTAAFQVASSLDATRSGATAMLVGNRFYLLGGESATLLSSFELASIMASTTVLGSPTTISGSTVPSTRIDYAMAVLGRHVYLLGGRFGGTTIEHATIAEDGTIGTFANLPINLSAAEHAYCGSVVAGRWLYVLGGSYAAANNASSERIPINDDGTLGTPETPIATGHPQATGAFGVTTAGFSVFTFEGQYYDVGTSTTKLYDGYGYNYAQGTDGALTTANLLGNQFAGAPKSFVRAVTLGRNVYVLGGSTVATTQFVFSSSGGTLGAGVASQPTNVVRNQPALAYVGDKLYVLGGFNSSVAINSWDAMVVGATGTLGVATSSPASFWATNGFSNMHATVIDNNVLMFGGVEGTTSGSKVQRVPIQ